MNSSYRSQITEELLSAYIDGAVTPQEKALMEEAIDRDPEVAWQVESLRQTVRLLSGLSAVPLPRSFVLTAAQVGGSLSAAQTTNGQVARGSAVHDGWQHKWGALIGFFAVGNPLLRNAAAAAVLLLFVLVGSDLWRFRLMPMGQTQPAPAMVSQEVALAPMPEDVAGKAAAEDEQAAAAPAAERAASQSAAVPQADVAVESSAPAAALMQAAPAGETPAAVATGDEQASALTARAAPMAAAATESAPVSRSAAAESSSSPAAAEVAESGPAALMAEAAPAPAEPPPSESVQAEAMQMEAVPAELAQAEEAQPELTAAVQAPAMMAPLTEPTTAVERAVESDMPAQAEESGTPAVQAALRYQEAPAQPSVPTGWALSPLSLAEIAAGLLALILWGLWWRSRAHHP